VGGQPAYGADPAYKSIYFFSETWALRKKLAGVKSGIVLPATTISDFVRNLGGLDGIAGRKNRQSRAVKFRSH
jgi:hypothetical protein